MKEANLEKRKIIIERQLRLAEHCRLKLAELTNSNDELRYLNSKLTTENAELRKYKKSYLKLVNMPVLRSLLSIRSMLKRRSRSRNG
jgi:hypothetical protein